MSTRALETLLARYDRDVFAPARVRLVVVGEDARDAVLAGGSARFEATAGEVGATITADRPTWDAIARDLRGGMSAFQAGRLSVRRDLHLGVGFRAATSGDSAPGRLRFRTIATRRMAIATMEAGQGPPVVAVHGLGGTKASFLPTLAALGDRFRVIAMDLPGFGDSDTPIAAPYDAPFFARTVVDLLDALELERAHVVGNSLGGRVALELALREPERAGRLALLAPCSHGVEAAPGLRCSVSCAPSSGSCSSPRGRSSSGSCMG